ncbi:ABC transporter substrate-binding protein [Streptomyces coryli]|nr:ABC transporter substrate-binding protein [Streptomyces coryli]
MWRPAPAVESHGQPIKPARTQGDTISRHTTTRIRRLGALVALLALTAAGCGDEQPGGATSGKAKGLEKSTITVGQMPIIDDAQLQLAIDRGLFKDEGLTVNTRMIQTGADAIPALKGGSLDISYGAYPSWFQAQEKKVIDLKVVSDAYSMRPGALTVSVPKDSAIKSAKDLAGKKIAVNARHNMVTLLLHAGLKPHGVKLDEEKNTVEMPFPQMEAALKNGSVDAAIFAEPFPTQTAKNIGARVVLDCGKGPTADMPIGSYATTADFAAKHPKTVAAFQRAIAKAQKMLAEPAVRKEIIPKYTKIPPALVPDLKFGDYPAAPDVAKLEKVTRIMRDIGYLKKPLDIEPLLVNS